MGSTAGDSRDVNVLEIGRPLALLFREGGHGVRIAACGTVYVVALENDGFVFDVGHHDVRDIQLFGLATTSDAAFEAKTSVGARETTVTNHHATNARSCFAAQHKGSVSMEDGAILNEDIFDTTDGSRLARFSAFHAQAIVASVDGAIDDKHTVAVADVDGITVLGIPRTAHGNAVDDDIRTVTGVYVELGRMLEGDTLEEHIVTVKETHQVVTHLFLFLWSVHDVWIARCHLPGIPQLPVLFVDASHVVESFPLYIADLTAFDRTPLLAITVDDAAACDGDIMLLTC